MIGALAAMVGIRPKAAQQRYYENLWDNSCITNFEMIYLVKRPNPNGEQLRLVLDEYCVDLPEDRYTDSVDVDWAYAKDCDIPHEARCRVRPNPESPWEELPLKRVDG
jgi:hypothetical protein